VGRWCCASCRVVSRRRACRRPPLQGVKAYETHQRLLAAWHDAFIDLVQGQLQHFFMSLLASFMQLTGARARQAGELAGWRAGGTGCGITDCSREQRAPGCAGPALDLARLTRHRCHHHHHCPPPQPQPPQPQPPPPLPTTTSAHHHHHLCHHCPPPPAGVKYEGLELLHQALRATAGPEPGSAFAEALAAATPAAPAPADQANDAVRPALILLLAKVRALAAAGAAAGSCGAGLARWSCPCRPHSGAALSPPALVPASPVH
jgi:hypothetical protein